MKTLVHAPTRRPRPRTLPRTPAPNREEVFDREYWLGHCEGFRVDAHGARLGFVEGVREGAEPKRGTTLVIRAGRLGRRLLLVPAGEIDFIVPRAQRIWLRSPVSIFGIEADGAAGGSS